MSSIAEILLKSTMITSSILYSSAIMSESTSNTGGITSPTSRVNAFVVVLPVVSIKLYVIV